MRLRILATLMTLLALALAGCTDGGDTDDGMDGGDGMDGMDDGMDDGSDGMDSGQTFTVRVRDFEFDPPTLEVPAGSTVRWVVDEGSMAHSVTADDGSFDSGIGFSTFEHTFDEAGDHPYHCIPHQAGGMVGEITVT